MTERNRIATTMSFSTDQETAKMLDELIWHYTLTQQSPATRSQVLTDIIRKAWTQAAVAQSKQA